MKLNDTRPEAHGKIRIQSFSAITNRKITWLGVNPALYNTLQQENPAILK